MALLETSRLFQTSHGGIPYQSISGKDSTRGDGQSLEAISPSVCPYLSSTSRNRASGDIPQPAPAWMKSCAAAKISAGGLRKGSIEPTAREGRGYSARMLRSCCNWKPGHRVCVRGMEFVFQKANIKTLLLKAANRRRASGRRADGPRLDIKSSLFENRGKKRKRRRGRRKQVRGERD